MGGSRRSVNEWSEYERIIEYEVRRFGGLAGFDTDDLRQEASLAVSRALDRVDPSRRTTSAYVRQAIRNSLINLKRTAQTMSRVPHWKGAPLPVLSLDAGEEISILATQASPDASPERVVSSRQLVAELKSRIGDSEMEDLVRAFVLGADAAHGLRGPARRRAQVRLRLAQDRALMILSRLLGNRVTDQQETDMESTPETPADQLPECHPRGTDPLGYDPEEKDLCWQCPDKFSCLPESIDGGLVDLSLDDDHEVASVLGGDMDRDHALARMRERRDLTDRGADVPAELIVRRGEIEPEPEVAEEEPESPAEEPEEEDTEEEPEDDAEAEEAAEEPEEPEEEPDDEYGGEASALPHVPDGYGDPEEETETEDQEPGDGAEDSEDQDQDQEDDDMARKTAKRPAKKTAARRTTRKRATPKRKPVKKAAKKKPVKKKPVKAAKKKRPLKKKAPKPRDTVTSGPRVDWPKDWPHVKAGPRMKPLPRPRKLKKDQLLAALDRLNNGKGGIGAPFDIDIGMSIVRKRRNGEEVVVKVMATGFVMDGTTYSSLTACAMWAEHAMRSGNDYFSVAKHNCTEVRGKKVPNGTYRRGDPAPGK